MSTDKPTIEERALPIHPLELKVAVVCDACGCIVKASWVAREEAPREMIIVVEKCNCDSPLLND